MLGSNKRICFLFYKTWKVHGKFQEPQTQDSKCEIEDVEWRRLKFKTNCERCVLNKLLTISRAASNFSVVYSIRASHSYVLRHISFDSKTQVHKYISTVTGHSLSLECWQRWPVSTPWYRGWSWTRESGYRGIHPAQGVFRNRTRIVTICSITFSFWDFLYLVTQKAATPTAEYLHIM